MEEKNLIILCITAIICVIILSAAMIFLSDDASKLNDMMNNDSVNVTLNDTNDTQNYTTATKTKKSTKKNTDPDYDPERDDSHKGATEDNPITVYQSDGVYTYYGPGHYDYYAGDNHMSGEYYKIKNQE